MSSKHPREPLPPAAMSAYQLGGFAALPSLLDICLAHARGYTCPECGGEGYLDLTGERRFALIGSDERPMCELCKGCGTVRVYYDMIGARWIMNVPEMVAKEFQGDAAARICVIVQRRADIEKMLNDCAKAIGRENVEDKRRDTLNIKGSPRRVEPSLTVLWPNASIVGARFSYIVAPKDLGGPEDGTFKWFQACVLSRLVDGGRVDRTP